MGKNTKRPLLLTTIDNPHSPFEDFPQWYMEDIRLGHDTCGLIARHAVSSNLFPDDAELEAMRTIVELNLSGKHLVVTPLDYDPFLDPQLKDVVSN